MMVYLSTRPVRIATAMPSMYSENTTPAPSRRRSGGEHRKDRQTGTARHERRHHDSNQALALGVQRPGTHDGRHVAAEADDQRHEGFARQPERLHQAIHHERRARHVAGILREGQEQVHHADLRHQRQHGVDATADALRQKTVSQSGKCRV